MLTSISIVIGLVFVLLLFSLLASTVMEVIASIFSLRARNLRDTLDNMLGEEASNFMRHPLFRQLAYATNRKNRLSSLSLPSYVSKDTFLAILMDMMGEEDKDQLEEKIAKLDEGDLKRLMQFLFRQSGGNPNKFREKAGKWFDEVMNRASEWYTRRVKYILFAVGLVLAFIFNVDTIQVYQSIASSATIQQHLLEVASQYVEQQDSVQTVKQNSNLEESMAQLDNAWQQFEYNTSPLGIGWGSIESDLGLPGWLIKLAGFLISAIAVTLGAPFWFDLLKKMLNIRGGTKVVANEKTESGEGTATSASSVSGTNTSIANKEEENKQGGPVG
ncbi:MAG: hypothetical protein MI974_02145 [Chitinophagales bacterium]|nr:hypothetical protein [Chitinophagales bacterium]